MGNQYQYLFLASGVSNGEGYWLVGTQNCDENILDDPKILDCHRKELVGYESAKDILFAINSHLNNLFDELNKNNYLFKKPSLVISFNFPLVVLENIFDFWLDIYKEKENWETCLGLLKIRERISFSSLIKKGVLKGNSKKWAIKIELLHSYKPYSLENKPINIPMWK